MTWVNLTVTMLCLGYSLGTGRRLWPRPLPTMLWVASPVMLALDVWNIWWRLDGDPAMTRAVMTLGAATLGLSLFGVGFQAGHRGWPANSRD